MEIETVKVKPWGEGQGDFVEINKSDYDPSLYQLYEEKTSDPEKQALVDQAVELGLGNQSTLVRYSKDRLRSMLKTATNPNNDPPVQAPSDPVVTEQSEGDGLPPMQEPSEPVSVNSLESDGLPPATSEGE